MDPTKATGNGAKLALTGVAAPQMVTLLTYILHLYGINDMPPEVANAIVGIAFGVAGGIMHAVEVVGLWITKRGLEHAERLRGVMGGAPAAPA